MFRTHCISAALATCVAVGLTPYLTAQDSPQAQASWVSDSNNDVIAVVPKSRNIVSAFSVDTGTWGSIELADPLPPKSNVSVYGKLAVFESKDCIYSFSAKRAIWDKLPIPNGATPSIASYGSHIQVRMAGSLFVYSVNSRKWTGKNLSTGQDAMAEPQGQITK